VWRLCDVSLKNYLTKEAVYCNFNSPDEIMVKGPGADTELLRRREVPTPEKQKMIACKGNLSEPIRKPVSLKESEGRHQAEQINRKEKKISSIVRCRWRQD